MCSTAASSVHGSGIEITVSCSYSPRLLLFSALAAAALMCSSGDAGAAERGDGDVVHHTRVRAARCHCGWRRVCPAGPVRRSLCPQGVVSAAAASERRARIVGSLTGGRRGRRSTITGCRASGVLLTDARTAVMLKASVVAGNGMHGCSVQAYPPTHTRLHAIPSPPHAPIPTSHPLPTRTTFLPSSPISAAAASRLGPCAESQQGRDGGCGRWAGSVQGSEWGWVGVGWVVAEAGRVRAGRGDAGGGEEPRHGQRPVRLRRHHVLPRQVRSGPAGLRAFGRGRGGGSGSRAEERRRGRGRGRGRLEENEVAGNRRSGLVVMDSARAALRGNRFADNAKCGVLCHGGGVRVALAGDALTRNVGSGLVIQADPPPARRSVACRARATRGPGDPGPGDGARRPRPEQAS